MSKTIITLSMSALCKAFLDKHVAEMPEYINANAPYPLKATMDKFMEHGKSTSPLFMSWSDDIPTEIMQVGINKLHSILDLIDSYTFIVGQYDFHHLLENTPIRRTNVVCMGKTDSDREFITTKATGVIQVNMGESKHFTPMITIGSRNNDLFPGTESVVSCLYYSDDDVLHQAIVDSRFRSIIHSQAQMPSTPKSTTYQIYQPKEKDNIPPDPSSDLLMWYENIASILGAPSTAIGREGYYLSEDDIFVQKFITVSDDNDVIVMTVDSSGEESKPTLSDIIVLTPDNFRMVGLVNEIVTRTPEEYINMGSLIPESISDHMVKGIIYDPNIMKVIRQMMDILPMLHATMDPEFDNDPIELNHPTHSHWVLNGTHDTFPSGEKAISILRHDYLNDQVFIDIYKLEDGIYRISGTGGIHKFNIGTMILGLRNRDEQLTISLVELFRTLPKYVLRYLKGAYSDYIIKQITK